MSRIYAVKALNHSMNGNGGTDVCLYFIQALGLKRIFPLFLGQGNKKFAGSYKEFSEAQDDEHVISIIANLFKATIDKPEFYARLRAKFLEKECEKVSRLLSFYNLYSIRLGIVEHQLAEAPEEDRNSDMDYLTRLDAGLYTLQMTCLIIGFLFVDNAEPVVS